MPRGGEEPSPEQRQAFERKAQVKKKKPEKEGRSG